MWVVASVPLIIAGLFLAAAGIYGLWAGQEDGGKAIVGVVFLVISALPLACAAWVLS